MIRSGSETDRERMARKDISDLLVIKAYFDYKDNYSKKWPYEILAEWTGQPEKVCYSACERALKRDLLDYGVSLRSGWVTEKGKKLLEQKGAGDI